MTEPSVAERIETLRQQLGAVRPGAATTVAPELQLLRWVQEITEIVRLLELRGRFG